MAKKTTINLTKLESEVMSVIWDSQPEDVTVRDVVDELNRLRGQQKRKKLAYNTVQTIAVLLKEKKAIRQVRAKTRSQGRAHFFSPCISRDQASKHVLSDLAQRMFGGQLKPLIHQVIDDAELSAKELEELRKWVDAKLKDTKGNDD